MKANKMKSVRLNLRKMRGLAVKKIEPKLLNDLYIDFYVRSTIFRLHRLTLPERNLNE